MKQALALPLLALALASPAFAAPDVSGGWQLIGQDANGRYRGTATLSQDAQGRVTGTITQEYVRWSWSARAYVPTGRHGAARITARVVGDELRGTRRRDAGMAGVLGLGGSNTSSIRYRVYERGGRLTAIRGVYAGGSWEQLHQQQPVTTAREQDLLRLRAALESATNGMIWMSESDDPFTYVQYDGAAANVASVDDFRRVLGVEAGRPAQERTLADTLGWRVRHEPGESPEEAAEVDRHIALQRLLESNLTDIRVYRVGSPDALASHDGSDIYGEIHVYIVGRNAYGDLVGLKTISVET